MKPFDLRKALDGEPVVTRDGRKVKIAGYNEDASELSRVAGWVIGEYGVGCWGPDGMVHGIDECNFDLFMADPEPVMFEGWVNVYPVSDNKGFFCSWVHKTETDALGKAANNAIATIKITFPIKP